MKIYIDIEMCSIRRNQQCRVIIFEMEKKQTEDS